MYQVLLASSWIQRRIQQGGMESKLEKHLQAGLRVNLGRWFRMKGKGNFQESEQIWNSSCR